MIKGALIFLITLNLISCNIKTKISDVSQSYSNQNNSSSYIGNYLTANYSIIKGDAYTASQILDKNLSNSRKLVKDSLSIPLHEGLRVSEINYIINNIKNVHHILAPN